MKRFKLYIKNFFDKNDLHPLQKAGLLGLFFLVGMSALSGEVGQNLQKYTDYILSAILPGTVVELTNVEREQSGLHNLSRCSVLDEAARLKAEHMRDNEYFSHFSPGDNVSPWHWFKVAGYDYIHAGENLAIYFNNSEEVVRAWMESPLHRDNILKKNYTEIGVAAVEGVYKGYRTVYVVQLFGTPMSTVLPSDPGPEPAPVLAMETERDEPNILGEETVQESVTEEVIPSTEKPEQHEQEEMIRINTVPAGDGFAYVSGHFATTPPLLPAIVGEMYPQKDPLPTEEESTSSNGWLHLSYLITALFVGLSFFSSVLLSVLSQTYIQTIYGTFLFTLFILSVYTHFQYVLG